jgi:hypothetical protein
VWDGSNDYNFFPGQALEYDQRGSVFVVGAYDHDGNGSNGRIYQWNQLRAEGASTWTGIDRQSGGSGGNSKQTVVLKSRTPLLGGFTPSYLDQGLIWFAYGWASGASETQQTVDMGNADYYSNATTTYPTMLGVMAGEPFFRLADATTRTAKDLGANRAPLTSFPSIKPSFSYKTGSVFATNEAEFAAGYSAQIARMSSGQRVITVVFDNVKGDGDKDTVVNYVLARQRDGNCFYWFPPDEERDLQKAVNVKMTPAPIRPEQVQNAKGEWVWAFGFQMLEVLR